MFKNLEVQIELKSPVVFGRYPLQLDSLIYWSLESYLGNNDKTLEAMKSVLKKTDDVFHASQAITDDPIETIGIGRSRNNNLFNSLTASVIMPEKPANLNLNTISIYKGFQIKHIKFYCVGHKDLIQNLLSQLNGIGCFSSSGYGQISSIDIKEIEEDWSFIKSGQLNKILPQTFVQKHGIEVPANSLVLRIRYAPPYIESKTENCFVPVTELRSK